MRRMNIRKTARFVFKLSIEYVLQSWVISVTICTRVEAQTDWTVTTETEEIIINII